MSSSLPPASGRPRERTDLLLAAALFAATFASRIPFRTTLLYAWDSVLYTRALDDFDITVHHPQPPGHIFYVGLIRLVNYFLQDANSAMVWISIFAAAAAVTALFWFGSRLFGRRAGLAAALLLATSTSFWSYSEVAYPYTLLGFLSIAVAAAIWQLWQGDSRWALPAAALLGLASGFRQDLLFFMLPLLGIGLWGMGWRRIAAAAGVLGAAVAAWYVPSALFSGGFGVYRQASSVQTAYLLDNFSVFGLGAEALGINIRTLARFLLPGLSAAIPVIAIFIVGLATPLLRPCLRDRRFWFLTAWTLPSLLFYVFIHIGEYGYVFFFLPAAMLAGAWALEALMQKAGDRFPPGSLRGGGYALTAGLLIAVNLTLYLAVPTSLSAQRVTARDDILRCRIDSIRDGFDPATTLIVSVYDYQLANYYLPEFTHWNFDPALNETPSLALAPGIRTVVIFEEYLQPAQVQDSARQDICLGQSLISLEAEDETRVAVDWEKRWVDLAP